MNDNITNKLIQRISATDNDDKIRQQLQVVLNELENIYSYLIYARYKQDKLAYWQIEYTVSQIDEYNTLQANIAEDEIFTILKSSIETKISNVIGYKQPSLDIQIKLFEPFINKCALKQVQRWPQLELDDAQQICRLTMLNLYNKGYYLHPTLIERCYNNDILVSIRKDKNKPEIISIDTIVHRNEDNSSLTLADMLPDTAAYAEGEKSGRAERELEMAKALKSKGVDIDIIAETSGLSKTKIKML